MFNYINQENFMDKLLEGTWSHKHHSVFEARERNIARMRLAQVFEVITLHTFRYYASRVWSFLEK